MADFYLRERTEAGLVEAIERAHKKAQRTKRQQRVVLPAGDLYVNRPVRVPADVQLVSR